MLIEKVKITIGSLIIPPYSCYKKFSNKGLEDLVIIYMKSDRMAEPAAHKTCNLPWTSFSNIHL